MNNPATLPIGTMKNTSDLSTLELHHCHMSALRRVVSSLTNGWHCPSWEPTVERISSCKRSVGPVLSLLAAVSRSGIHHDYLGYLYPLRLFVTFTVRAALSTNHRRHQSKSCTVFHLTSKCYSVFEKRCTSIFLRGTDNEIKISRVFSGQSLVIMCILLLVLHSIVPLPHWVFTRMCRLTWVYF